MINIENEHKINLKKLFFGKSKIIFIIASISILILLPLLAWKVFIDDGSYNEEDGNTGYTVRKNLEAKTQNVVSKDNGWSVDLDLETTVDEIIAELEKYNGNIDKYIPAGKQKEYLTAFIKAGLITQYPDMRTDFSIPPEEGEFQGCIQIIRSMTDGTTKRLTYVPYDTFKSYVENKQSEALDHFSLDKDGSLVVAGWSRVITNVTSNDPGVENIDNYVEYDMAAKPIPYKTSVDYLSMPFDFLWALTVSGQDAEFAFNVAQLALKSEIVITVKENFSTSFSESVETYDIQERSTQHSQHEVKYQNNTTYPEHEKVTETQTTYKIVRSVKTESCAIKANITKADTWIQRYENTYTEDDTPGNGIPVPGTPQKFDDTEFEDTGENVGVTTEFQTEALKKLQEYLTELCGGEQQYQTALTDGTCSAKVKEMTHKKEKRIINHQIETTSIPSAKLYTIGTPTVTEKMDKDSSEENFVTLFLNSESAKTSILGAPEWLFEMLESSSETSNMVELVKYLLYKATGLKQFEVKNFKMRLIDISEFKSISGSSTENFIKAWENDGLWRYETKQSAFLPSEYLTEDEQYYIVYEDGSAGHNNIAYGWATYITDSSNVKVNHPQYGGGYYNHEVAFANQGIDVKPLKEGDTVPKAAADAAFSNEILKFYIDKVEIYLKENLAEYEFSQQQKDALISMCYQYGNLSNGNFDFATSYKNSLNADGTLNAEKIRTNCSRFNYTSIVNNREYANWLLFTQGKYIDRAGEEIHLGLLASAKKIHDYMSENRYFYCIGGKENPETLNAHLAEGLKCGLTSSFEASKEPNSWGHRLTCCATYVSWVLVDCGEIDSSQHDNGCRGVADALDANGWTTIEPPKGGRIPHDELMAGDIVFMETDGIEDGTLDHVQIYLGNDQWYNAGGIGPIQAFEPGEYKATDIVLVCRKK